MNNIIKTLLIIALFTTALSQLPPKRGSIDKEFDPYIEQWVKDAKQHLGEDYKMPTVTIAFGKVDAFRLSMEGSPIGVCAPIPYDPFVMIDRDFWRWQDKGAREQLLFHELGHCVLWRLKHTSKMITKYRPISIMHPVLIMEGYTYFNHREYYIKELFTSK